MDAENSHPHTERWAYRKLYNAGTFEWTSRLYPFFSRRTFQRVCRSVAAFYARTQPGVCRVVEDNLRLLRPEEIRKSHVFRVFDRFATTIADYTVVGAMQGDEVDTLVDEYSGLEFLQKATESGKGAILATAHYSFFELGSVVLARMGYPVSIVTLSEPSPDLTVWRSKWRERWGAHTIEMGRDAFSSLAVAHALQEGHCTAMLVDRPYGSQFHKIEFPGGGIHFSPSPAQLSWATGCPVLPVLIQLLPSGNYRIVTKPPIHARDWSDRNMAIQQSTEAMAAALLEGIQFDPTQWYQFVPVRA